MKVIESYWKDTVAVCLLVSTGVILCNSFSDFPSSSYANFYSTNRKSAKIASDSSLKLISYLSIFASNFKIVVALVIIFEGIMRVSITSTTTI